MGRVLARILWWIVASERPRSRADLFAILVLPGLAALGATAIAWPWLTNEAPRAIWTGWLIVQSEVSNWLRAFSASVRWPG